MAILADMKAFYRWLDEASADELAERRAHVVSAIRDGEITNRDVISEANYLVRQIEEEMVSRKLNI